MNQEPSQPAESEHKMLCPFKKRTRYMYQTHAKGIIDHTYEELCPCLGSKCWAFFIESGTPQCRLIK